MSDFTEEEILNLLTQAWRHGFHCARSAGNPFSPADTWHFEDACNDDLAAIISGRAEELGPIGEQR